METTTRQFIISMLLFSGLVTGCFYIIALSLPSQSTQSTLANSTMNKFIDIQTNANTISDAVQPGQEQADKDGVLEGLIKVSISALNSIWTSFETLGTITGSLGTAIGLTLPSWFTAMILAIVGIVVAFSLMAAWFKWWL